MNAEIESALETYLTAQLAGVENIAVHAATKRADLPKDRRFVVVTVKDCKRKETVALLYTPDVSVIVTTPILKGATVADHKELVKAALWALQPRVDADHDADDVSAAKSAMDAAVVDEAVMHCRSTWADGPKEAHTAEDWQTVLDARLCLTVD